MTKFYRDSVYGDILKQFPTNLPNDTESIDIRNYPLIKSISRFPNNLINLQLVNIGIKSLPFIPSSLEKIVIYECTELIRLPTNLRNLISLEVYACPKLKSIPKPPETLVSLRVRHCPLIKKLPDILPSKLKVLEFADSDITYLPILPDSITMINVDGTKIEQIEQLPKSLLSFCASRCKHLKKICKFPRYIDSITCTNSRLLLTVSLDEYGLLPDMNTTQIWFRYPSGWYYRDGISELLYNKRIKKLVYLQTKFYQLVKRRNKRRIQFLNNLVPSVLSSLILKF